MTPNKDSSKSGAGINEQLHLLGSISLKVNFFKTSRVLRNHGNLSNISTTTETLYLLQIKRLVIEVLQRTDQIIQIVIEQTHFLNIFNFI